MSYWWAHALTCVLACLYIKKVSKYYITWVLIANAFLFSTQPRFSIEFVLIMIGLSSWALSEHYLNLSKNKKAIIIFSLILISCAFTLMNKSINEKYVFLAWLPILISFFFPAKDKLIQKNNIVLTSFATVLTLLSSKKSIIFGFFAQYLGAIKTVTAKIILFISAISIFFFSFLFQDDLKSFYKKSIYPRSVIWKSAAKGFLNRPFTGNGFGIFPMEINGYRTYVENIGGKLNKHLNHAHNNFFHVAFEQGLVGIALLVLLLIFLYKYHIACFWTFVILSLFDSSLVYSSQYLLASLVFLPSIVNKEPLYDKKYFVIPSKYQNFAYQIILFLCLTSFGFSIIGHYYYDIKKYDLAIKFDSDHSLYQFFMGVKNLKKTKTGEAAVHFQKSIELSKNHGFQQGFLAVSYYILKEPEKSVHYMTEALKMSGNDPQWKYIAHLIFKELDPEFSKKLKTDALQENPVLSYYDKGLMPPKLSSIGGSEDSYFWINSYQRRSEKVFLPTPQL